MDMDVEGAGQLLVSCIDYNEFVGRIGIGRIERGVIRANEPVSICNYTDNKVRTNCKIANLYQIEGLERVSVPTAQAGDIVVFSGIDGLNIGDTVCEPTKVEPVQFVKIEEPTVEMTFSVNDSRSRGKRENSSRRGSCARGCTRSFCGMCLCASATRTVPILSASAAEEKCTFPSSSKR